MANAHQMAEAAKQVLGHDQVTIAETPGGTISVIDGTLGPEESLSDAVWAEIEVLAETLPAAPAPDPYPDLTKPQWAWALAQKAGTIRLEETLERVRAWADENDDATYALLQRQTAQDSFNIDVTLGLLSSLSQVIASVAPEADVSEATIRAIWADAAEQ